MNIEELVSKYCNGTDDIKLFYSILNLIGDAGDEFEYRLDEDKEDVEDLNLDNLIDAFIEKANFNSIVEHDDLDTTNIIDFYENDDYNGGHAIHYVFLFPQLYSCGDFGKQSIKLFRPFLKANKYITSPDYPDHFFIDQEALDDYDFRCTYASNFLDGLDIYEFLKYLKDNGLDVYNDDIDICYGSKTVYTYEENVLTKANAEEILKKIKEKIKELNCR